MSPLGDKIIFLLKTFWRIILDNFMPYNFNVLELES